MAGKNQSLPIVTLRDRREAKSDTTDTTTRAAQQIINAEAAAREAKSERLRRARLAQKPNVPPLGTGPQGQPGDGARPTGRA